MPDIFLVFYFSSLKDSAFETRKMLFMYFKKAWDIQISELQNL